MMIEIRYFKSMAFHDQRISFLGVHCASNDHQTLPWSPPPGCASRWTGAAPMGTSGDTRDTLQSPHTRCYPGYKTCTPHTPGPCNKSWRRSCWPCCCWSSPWTRSTPCLSRTTSEQRRSQVWQAVRLLRSDLTPSSCHRNQLSSPPGWEPSSRQRTWWGRPHRWRSSAGSGASPACSGWWMTWQMFGLKAIYYLIMS